MELNIISLMNFLSSGFQYLLIILSPETFSSNQLLLAPALYCFGDSLFDSGNNNYLPTQERANFTPYGIDYVNGPTGRFTNNKTVADSFAEKLGLPFAPPYLGLVGKLMPLSGVNYASASCGILDETGKQMGECLHLSKQVDYFEETILEIKRQYFFMKFLTKAYLAQSIFVTSIGSNDYFNNYLQPGYSNASTLTPDQFAQLLVDKFSQQLTRLYNLGARKILVFDIGAVGCIPAIVASTNTTGPCSDPVNQMVNLYNQNLGQRLQLLETILPGSKIVFGASFEIALNVNLNPTQYGFQAKTVPCCEVNFKGKCVVGGAVSEDWSKYISFDAIHPTDAMYSIFANSCFDGSPSICSPITLQELAASRSVEHSSF